MRAVRVGVMGCSSFAKRAMMPALVQCGAAKLTAVASRTRERAQEFAKAFDCEAVEGYENLLSRADIEAVYMPLPTGLHEEWVTKALAAGKHLLVEKSFAEKLETTEKMVSDARRKNLLVMENYLFPHHSQYKWIRDFVESGELGDIHLVRSTFGFPPPAEDNFRYNKELGGGALLDAGGYVIMIVRLLLGDDLDLLGSALQYNSDLGVDIYGDAMFRNAQGQVAQVSFGFDYYYQCNLELLGTKGKLTVDRLFTPPPGFSPVVRIEHQGRKQELSLRPDNHYANMIGCFSKTILEKEGFSSHWDSLVAQARLLEAIARDAKDGCKPRQRKG